MTRTLIDARALSAALATDRPPTVLDVRWKLGEDDGREQYRAGHIPGAHYVDLSGELAAPATTTDGRHPLPDIDELQNTVRAWGIDDDTAVVIYDDNGNQSAARAWWLLRWAGLDDVRLLDGGLAAWRDLGAGQAIGDEPAPAPGHAVLTADSLPTVTADDVIRIASGDDTATVLLDARAGERYRGEVEPVDPRAGHIPGAISAPTADNLAPDGRFLDERSLRERFSTHGADDTSTIVVYCGSGVTAAHQVAALHIAGRTAALYPGSWSQWSADPARPAATGAAPR
ncbi:sulfurtransferase [Gordonia sp. NPDC003376]